MSELIQEKPKTKKKPKQKVIKESVKLQESIESVKLQETQDYQAFINQVNQVSIDAPSYPELLDYPIEPTLYSSALLEITAPIMYPPMEGLQTETEQRVLQQENWSFQESAPPQELSPTTIDNVEKEKEEIIKSLNLDILESIFPISFEESGIWVQEFLSESRKCNEYIYKSDRTAPPSKGTPKNEGKEDNFYNQLLEFEKLNLLYESIKLKSKLSASQIQDLIDKVWTIETKNIEMKGTCQDGITLKHSYTLQSCICNQDLLSQLSKSLQDKIHFILEEEIQTVYSFKVLKLELQNFLDLTVYSITSFESVSNSIHSILFILFDFERRNTKLEIALVFRQWIMYLGSAFLPCTTWKDARWILLHLLRTSGSGSWAGSLIQWTIPSHSWTDEYIQHYMTSLAALLGPVEELELLNESKLASIAHLEEQLKKLEELDWVVVYEQELPLDSTIGNTSKGSSKDELALVLLMESDYSCLLTQFQLIEFYQLLLNEFMSVLGQESLNEDSHLDNQKRTNLILKTTTITHHFLLILIRGLFILPRNYTSLLNYIGESIITILEIFVSRVSNVDGSSFMYYKDSITTLQAEKESLILRTFQHLIKISKRDIWKFVACLPFRFLSKRALISLMKSLMEFVLENKESIDSKLTSKEQVGLLNSIGNVLYSCFSIGKCDMRNTLEALQLLFEISFTKTLYSPSATDTSQEILIRLLNSCPEYIHYILDWIRNQDQDSSLLQVMLWLHSIQLGLNQFKPNESDLTLLVKMLHKQDSIKSKLAIQILNGFNWEYELGLQTSTLCIPRHLIHSLTLSLVNLHLDFISSPKDTLLESIVSNVTSRVLGQDEFKFKNWIWKFMTKLHIYQPLGVRKISQESRPFIPFDSSSLSTLRGSMKTDSLSCFVLFLISDLSHQPLLFEKVGVELMSHLVLAPFPLVFIVLDLILCNFHHLQVFTVQLKPMITSLLEKNGSFPVSELPCLMESYLSNESNTSLRNWIGFWHSLILFSPISSTKLGQFLLDRVSKYSFTVKSSHLCQDSLSSLYLEKLNDFDSLSSATPLSFTRPLEAFVSIASQANRTWPVLAFRILDSNKPWWFLYDALCVESRLEKQYKSIASKLHDLSLEYHEVKPLHSFSIYKWYQEILSIPFDHPLIGLYLQIFCSLCFEFKSCGLRLFLTNPNYPLDKIISRLDSCVGSIRSDSAAQRDIQGHELDKRMGLVNILNAMSNWFRLKFQSDLILESIGPDLYPNYLKSCCLESVEFHVLHPWREFFTDFLSLASTNTTLASTNTTLSSTNATLASANTTLSSTNTTSTYTRTNTTLASRKTKEKEKTLLASLGTLKPPPPIHIHHPLVSTDYSCLNFPTVQERIKEILSKILQKSLLISKKIIQCKEFNSDYINHLKLLYTSSSIQNSLQKSCSKSSCTGPWICEYRTNKISLVQDIQSYCNDVYSRGLSSLESLQPDEELCLIGLKANTFVLPTKSCFGPLDPWISLFYTLLDACTFTLTTYPPCALILSRLLNLIGKEFINNETQTVLLWSKLTNPTLIQTVGHLFTPSAAPNHFVELYKQVSSRGKELKDDLSFSLLIKRFVLEDWNCPFPDEWSRLLFLILDSLDSLDSMDSVDSIDSIHKKQDNPMIEDTPYPLTRIANSELLKSLLITNPRLILQGLTVCFFKCIDPKTKYSTSSTFQLILNALFPIKAANPRLLLNSFELIPCEFDRIQIQTLLTDLRINQDYKLVSSVNLGVETRTLLSEMYILLFSNRSLYSLTSPFHIQQVEFELKCILTGWLSPKLDPEFLNTLILIVFKYYKNAGALPSSCPSFLWEFLIQIPSQSLADDYMSCLLQYSHVWTAFSLDLSILKGFLELKGSKSKEFFHHLIQYAILPRENTDFEYSSVFTRLLFSLAQESVLIWPCEKDRRLVLQVFIDKMDWNWNLNLVQFQQILELLPQSYEFQSTRLIDWQIDSDPLLFILQFCMKLGNPMSRDKLDVYQDYILALISAQICSYSLPSFIPSTTALSLPVKGIKTFQDSVLDKLLTHILVTSEEFDISHSFTFHSHALVSIIEVLNQCNLKSNTLVWNGILQGLGVTMYPLEYLDSCTRFAQCTFYKTITLCLNIVEFMALFIETCIERQLILSQGLVSWQLIFSRVIYPELDLDLFIKISLENALLFTLYSLAQKQLLECLEYDSKIKLGAQIAQWILKFKCEQLPVERESKLAVLLHFFSQLLLLEMNSDVSVIALNGTPRLVSFVESIAQLLLGLSQDKVSGGLWATLGFGPKSKFSLEFRFFCRGVGTFMGSRCLPLDSPERKDWIESMEGLHSNPEYDGLLLYLDPLMDDYLCNPDKDLSALCDLIQEQCLLFNLAIRFT